MKKSVKKFSYGKSFNEKVILGADALIQKAIDEGKSQEREEGITYHSLQHSAGIMIVYKNVTTSKTLVETLKFNMKGLVVKGDEEADEVEVRCGPGETKHVELCVTGGGWSFGMGMSYYIEE